jgi:tetratricopeptide (TPR) repeat protein
MTNRTAVRLGKRVAAFGLCATVAAAIGFAAFRASRFAGPGARLVRGEAAYTRGEWAESTREAHDVLKNDPANRAALLLLARSSARAGRRGAALAVYRQVGVDALEPLDYLLIGDGFSKSGQETPALSAWLNAERLDPKNPEALSRLAAFYHTAKQPYEALTRAQKLALDPGLGLRGAWFEARIFSDLDQPESAADPLEQILKSDDPSRRPIGIDRAEVVSLASRVNLRLGRPERALEILALAPGDEPDDESRWLASRALIQQGKAREAASTLAAVAPKPPLTREPAPYTGAASCRPCHRSNYESQQSSLHALTFQDQWDGPTAPSPQGAIADPVSSRVQHRLTNNDGATALETTVDGRTFRALVLYILGSGKHGQTLVVRDELGEHRESRVSYQPKRGAWSKTINHPDSPPDAIGYIGRPVSQGTARMCVHCHTTTASAVLSPATNRPHDRGIGCERCHGPGGNHIKAVALEFADPAIARPSLASAAEVTNLCAECHREPSSTMSPDSPDFIRFQAPTFMRSRCYTESGSFSCVSCHAPHKNAATSPSAYEAVCLKCHAPTKSAASDSGDATGDAKGRGPCPVNPTQGCLNCHMPKIPKAVPGAEFTDHYIRVREGPRTARPR